MKAVLQRVHSSSVTVNGTKIANIGKGLLVLLGVGEGDTKEDADILIRKLPHIRIFEDPEGKMNLSLTDIQGEMLIVSQFTLFGDCRKGRRPSFCHAAAPEIANELYLYVADELKKQGVRVQTGQFAAMMDVALINDGPVTLILDTKEF